MTFRILVPVPPEQLWPNARVHWGTHARVTAAYRRDCQLAAREALGTSRPLWRRAEARVLFVIPREVLVGGRRRSWGFDLWRADVGTNGVSALKAAWDALQDAGLLANDRGLVVHPADARPAGPGEPAGVVLEISERSEESVGGER